MFVWVTLEGRQRNLQSFIVESCLACSVFYSTSFVLENLGDDKETRSIPKNIRGNLDALTFGFEHFRNIFIRGI